MRQKLNMQITLFLLIFMIFSMSYAKDPSSEFYNAAMKGDIGALETLLNKGIDVNAKSKGGATALMYAAANGHNEVVKRLLDVGADVNAKGKDGETALILAAWFGKLETVKLLLVNDAEVNAKGINGGTALCTAASKGHADVVEMLIEYGADVNSKDNDGKTPLMLAAFFGYEETVIILLARGADINLRSIDGKTASEQAELGGYAEVIKIIREELTHSGISKKRAQFKKSGHEKANKLLFGAALKGDAAAVESLLNKGIDVNAKSKPNGWTALMYAASKGHNEVVKRLLVEGADVNIRNRHGETALILGTMYGRLETVKILLSNDANVNAKENNGRTALDLAASKGHAEVVEMLIDKGADINSKSNDGMTPLMHAASAGHLGIVKTLLARGADINSRSIFGGTALKYAKLKGHTEVIKVIHEKLAHSKKSGLETANALKRANTLLQQVSELFKKGRYDEAIPVAQNALDNYEKNLGPHHPSVADCLNNLAALYSSSGDYFKAKDHYERALSIYEKALGPDQQPHLAANLDRQIEHLGKRALIIPRLLTCLNNLAEIYRTLADYAKAETLFKRALAIREQYLGPETPPVAESLRNLAVFYYSLFDYEKAKDFMQRALAISENFYASDDPGVTTCLSDLSNLSYFFGDYPQAENLAKRALAINVRAMGPDHPYVAANLDSLARLSYSLGEYEKGNSYHQRALAIYEKAYGPDHSVVATSLNNMATIIWAKVSDYKKAEPLHMRALAIYEKAYGPDHPSVADSLSNLAGLYYSLGDYAKAEPLHMRALAIREKAFGPEHPRVADSLCNLAGLYVALSNVEKALELFIRAQEIDSKLIDQVMGFTSEDQKMKFLALKKSNLAGFLTLIDRHLIRDPGARKEALNVWLRRKGIILEAQRRFQEALVYSDDPEAVKTFQELARVRAQLSALAFGGPGKAGLDVHKKRLADIEAQKERLQAKLSKLSQAFAVSQKIARADSELVARTLPKKSVLLEFARIDMLNFKAKGKEKKWQPAHYLAFVLHAGKGDKVGMIDLGDAETIDREVSRFKKEISDVRDLKGKKVSKTSKKIYELVFAPLKKALGNVKEIFISPDGNLNLIPFEVLQGPDGRYLIEDYSFNYLAAGRDLVGFGAIKGKGEKALIIGDPDFDLGAVQKAATLRKLALRTDKDAHAAKRSMDMRGLHFQRLPGTREEAEAIWKLIGKDQCELFLDKKALEEVLEQKRTPRILHLATHGFFLSDMDFAGLMDDTMARGVMGIKELSRPIGKKFRIENPLLRSGIALAGANSALMTGDFDKTGGIVTAEKILDLRLRGTDLVVLSACDTGLGEVQSGEGVFGLRRAFTQAGTKSLIMSMWSVPDKETKELMVAFYKNIIKGGMDRCQALRQAALKEMEIVKRRYGTTNPLYWGAFIFMGQPG